METLASAGAPIGQTYSAWTPRRERGGHSERHSARVWSAPQAHAHAQQGRETDEFSASWSYASELERASLEDVATLGELRHERGHPDLADGWVSLSTGRRSRSVLHDVKHAWMSRTSAPGGAASARAAPRRRSTATPRPTRRRVRHRHRRKPRRNRVYVLKKSRWGRLTFPQKSAVFG